MREPSTPLERWTEAALIEAEAAMSEGRSVIRLRCFYCDASYDANVTIGGVSGRCDTCGAGINATGDMNPPPGQGGMVEIFVEVDING